MTLDEIIEKLSYAICTKTENRAVIDFHGEHEGETMLIDFSGCGEPFEDGVVCTWSLQKELAEEDWGQLTSYMDVFCFVNDTLEGKEAELYVECF